jgi:anti-sigma regulatory factor (Ser/Thr protein kinase)
MIGRVWSPCILAEAVPAAGDAVGARAGAAAPGSCRSRGLVPDPPLGGHENATVSKWPLRTYLELAALPTAVPCARLHVRHVTWEWGLPAETANNSELVLSELVTNACAASAAVSEMPVVRLWLLCDRAHVLILVWDASPQRPVRIDVDDEAESGRGLLLVETISSQWGCYANLDGDQGKVTWALL